MRRPRGPLAALSMGYGAIILIVLILTRSLGDLWWPATLLTYCPRIVFLAPVVILAALSAHGTNLALWWVQGATALLVVGPLMGLHLRGSLGAGRGEPEFVVATFNLGGASRSDAPRLLDWLGKEQVDLFCVQELSDVGLGEELGSRLEQDWLAITSPGFHIWARKDRFDALEAVEDESSEGGDWFAARIHDRREPSASGWIRIVDVHLPTIRWWANAAMVMRFEAMRAEEVVRAGAVTRLGAYLGGLPDVPTLVPGDFNMPATSGIWAGLGPNRLRAFAEAGLGYDYTIPAAWPWCGIDHILGSCHIRFTRCTVGPDLGSDHRPVIAGFRVEQ